MIYKTYLSKVNTIISGSPINTSLNPITELVYDKNVTRSLIYFDHSKIKQLMEDGTMPDKDKITHTLKLTNAGSVDFTTLHDKMASDISGCIRQRAASFELIFFLIPKEWDKGKGFDYSLGAYNTDYYDAKSEEFGNKLISVDGCSWFYRKNGLRWDEEGVYSNETLTKELEDISTEEGSAIIIGRQNFEVGNENINLDITDVVNKFVSGELENYGIGIAFSPQLERDGGAKKGIIEKYVGFFTNKTNTFFEPYVETKYNDHIEDDRANFVLGKNNKLYLYCNLGGNLEDLDETPLVTVTDSNEEIVTDADGNLLENIEAKHFSKGIYYIDLKISQADREADTMLFDTWSNVKYQGTEVSPVELDFTLKNVNMFFNIGNKLENNNRFIPNISGINDNEKIKRGDIRKIRINARVEYSTQDYELINGMESRLYIKDGTREIDVLEWEPVNKTFLENYTMIDTNILIPQRYYLDVKIKYGMEEIIHHDVLHFDIVDDLNNKYA